MNKKSIEYYLSVILFIILIVLCTMQVLFRFILNWSLSWTEELSRYVFIALVYSGGCMAVLQRKHVRVELIDNVLPKDQKYWYDMAVNLICGVVTGLIAWNSVEVVQNAFYTQQVSSALYFPMGYIYLVIPVAFVALTLRFVQVAVHIVRTKGEE